MDDKHVNMFNKWVVGDRDDCLEDCSLEELDVMVDRLERMLEHLEGKYARIMIAMGQLASMRMREVSEEIGWMS